MARAVYPRGGTELSHAWRNLEDTTLSEDRQPRADKYRMSPLHEIPRRAKCAGTAGRAEVRGWGEHGRSRFCFVGTVSIWVEDRS